MSKSLYVGRVGRPNVACDVLVQLYLVAGLQRVRRRPGVVGERRLEPGSQPAVLRDRPRNLKSQISVMFWGFWGIGDTPALRGYVRGGRGVLEDQ